MIHQNEPAAGASSESNEGLATQTVQRIETALRENETACVAQVVELIREITTKPDTISVQNLAELLERDLTLVTKVLSVANTIACNPEGVEITTMVQAIQAVGFNRIRNLAVSLLLLQNAQAEPNSADCRETSTLAVTSGYVAQTISGRQGLGDPGHAFVCAALRHYGKLLLTTFLMPEYRLAVAASTPEAPDRGYVQVFGLTPLELARLVLEHSNLPDSILGTLRECTLNDRKPASRSASADLLPVVDFAARLADLLRTAGEDPESFAVSAKRLAMRYEAVWGEGGFDVIDLVREVNGALGLLRGSFGMTPLLARIERLATQSPTQASPASPAASPTPAPPPKPGRDPGEGLSEGINQINELLEHHPVRLDLVFRVASFTLQQALRLEDCWVMVGQASGRYRVEAGSGRWYRALSPKVEVDPAVRSVFSVVFERGEWVAIARPDDPRILNFVPAWMHPIAAASSFLFIPVRAGDRTLAVLCGLGPKGRTAELPAAIRQSVNVLARLTALAMRSQ